MEKTTINIFTSIILGFLTISLAIPLEHISALQGLIPLKGSDEQADDSTTSGTTDSAAEQTSKDSEPAVKISEIQSQQDNHAESLRELSRVSGHKLKATHDDDNTPLQTKQLKQTAKSSSSIDIVSPGKVGTIFVKIVSDNRIDLKWTGIKGPDFNHYNVYMYTKPSFKVSPGVTVPSGTSNTNSYSSTGLDPSTRYYYKIAAVDDANNIGPLSNTKSGMTKSAATSTQNNSPTQELTGLSSSSTMTTSSADTSPPAQVTGLIIRTLSSTELYLTWTRVSASDFNHYNIYRGTSGFTVTPGVTVPTGTSTTSSFANTGLSPSTTYSYRVAAVDNAGNIGALSSQVSKTTAASSTSTDKTPPAQVTGLSVSTASSTQLNLQWIQNKELDLYQYLIYRGTSSGFSVTPGVTSPAGTSMANSYSSTGLSPSTKYYYKVAAKDNAGNIGPLSAESSATTGGSTSTGNVYDDFQASTYKLTDGQKSPNGKWLSKWNAGGEMGVKTENGNNVFYGFPQTATSSGQTFSSFALSTQKFSDMTLDLDMKTYKQLRQNSAPNSWETAWVMWRWTDLFHHYYFVIKTNGIEFGKKDTSCSCEQQVFLKTGSSPTLSLGTWDHIKISSIGKHTTIWVDGTKVVDMDDPSYSSTADMSGGYIGLYNEDASSAFDKVTVTPQ
jgi:chitodextrinase